MICPVCHLHETQRHDAYGVLPCQVCQERRAAFHGPDHPVEFTSSEIKEGRKSHLRSTVQPWRSGELSREYLDLYGPKNISASKEEIDRAKPVWTDLANIDNLTKTT